MIDGHLHVVELEVLGDDVVARLIGPVQRRLPVLGGQPNAGPLLDQGGGGPGGLSIPFHPHNGSPLVPCETY